METFQPKSLPGITKIAGIVICIGGVLFIAFYQGTKLKPLNLLHIESFLHRSRNHNYVNENRNRWMLGSFLLFLCGLFWALCTVLQGMLLKEYPDNLLLSTLMTIFSTFQSCIIAFIFEKNMEKWKMHWDVGLLAVVYNGVFVAGPVLYLTGYCIKRKGAVFTAMFSPVTVVFTLIIASVLLGEITSLGSVLGCLLMIGGLYCVLWGKSREKKHVVEH